MLMPAYDYKKTSKHVSNQNFVLRIEIQNFMNGY